MSVLKRSVLIFFYWPLRPVLRPLAWRLRTFLSGPFRAELDAVRANQRDILAAIAELRGMRERRSEVDPTALEAALLTLAMNRRPD